MDLWDETFYTDTYQPANDFSWICGSNCTSWTLSAYKNDTDKGKYLTTEEVVEILNAAKEYHIDVIPAFDSLSHLDYLTWTYEQNYFSNSAYSFYSTYDSKTYYAKDVNGIINYTNSYYSLAYKSGSYATFHAYYSTTEPSNYVCDYSDMSYCTSYSCCSNSQWFFVTAVNTQKYSEYSKYTIMNGGLIGLTGVMFQ